MVLWLNCASYICRVNSLTTVLEQEAARFNKLLKIVINSLQTLKKAIAGLVLMGEQMEGVYASLIDSKVSAIFNGFQCLVGIESIHKSNLQSTTRRVYSNRDLFKTLTSMNIARDHHNRIIYRLEHAYKARGLPL